MADQQTPETHLSLLPIAQGLQMRTALPGFLCGLQVCEANTLLPEPLLKHSSQQLYVDKEVKFYKINTSGDSNEVKK